MQQAVQLNPGCFGKLPAHGDFLDRNLPNSFWQPLDQWLQNGLSVSLEQLADNWLDAFLTSPIWHFAWSTGCLDNNAWLGLMVPSVDRVGRYFPFCIAAPIEDNLQVLTALQQANPWFSAAEKIAIDALEQQLSIETVAQQLELLPPLNLNLGPDLQPGGVTYLGNSEDQKGTYARLMHQFLAQNWPSFSIWQTEGASRVAAGSWVFPSLPASHQFAGLIDQQWLK